MSLEKNFKVLRKLVRALPQELEDGCFTPVIEWLLETTGLDAGFHATVLGSHAPLKTRSSVVNISKGFFAAYQAAIYRGPVYVDALFMKSFEAGFCVARTSRDVTPNYKSSLLDETLRQYVEISDVVNYAIIDGHCTQQISLIKSEGVIEPETVALFQQCVDFIWKIRHESLIEYGVVPTLKLKMKGEKSEFSTVDRMEHDLESLHQQMQAEIAAVENREDTVLRVQIVKDYIKKQRTLIKKYTETSADRWKEKCPALLEWSSDPEFKKNKLLRKTDERTGRKRYENASEYIHRCVIDAGVMDAVPYLHEIRAINPILARSLDALAKRANRAVSNYIPMRKEDTQ